MEMRRKCLTIATAIIIAVFMTIPVINTASVYAESQAAGQGVVIYNITAVHINNDNLTQAEIIKYEAALKTAFDSLVTDNTNSGTMICTIKTNKFTLNGREAFISGIDTFVIEGGAPVKKSMNISASSGGCPSAFSYTFDSSSAEIDRFAWEINFRAVDGSFEEVFKIYLDLEEEPSEPEPTPTEPTTPEPTPAPEPAKTVTGVPLTKMTAQGKTAMTITWQKTEGAEGYDIFFGKCDGNGKETAKKVKTIKGSSKLTWKKTGLKAGDTYKAYVKAYVMKDGKKKYVASSPLMHAYAKGYNRNYTNAKSVKVNKTEVSINKGKTFKIKASVRKLKKGKKLMPKKHEPTLRYLSTDKSVATVSGKGKIKGVKAGTCYVYAFAHNGVSKKIKVTVN